MPHFRAMGMLPVRLTDRLPRLSVIILGLYAIVALLADLIAGGRPLVVRDFQNGVHFPVVENWLAQTGLHQPRLVPPGGIWQGFRVKSAVWPPIPYGASETNLMGHTLLSPFSQQAWEYGHYLGTDALGRDVLSGIIQGARFSIGIATAGMLAAGCLGLMLGLLAGWWGDSRLRPQRRVVIGSIGSILLLVTQILVSPLPLSLPFAQAVLILNSSWWLLVYLTSRLFPGWSNRRVTLPLESGLAGLVVLLSAFPAFLLVLSLSQSIGPGVGLVIVSLAVLGWPLFALLVRDETRRLRQVEFIESGLTLGYSDLRLQWIHIVPQLLPRLQVAFGLGLVQAVLVESALSYLGLGLPLDWISWGSLIASAQSQPGAWWLLAGPGLALLGFVATLMNLSEGMGHSVV